MPELTNEEIQKQIDDLKDKFEKKMKCQESNHETWKKITLLEPELPHMTRVLNNIYNSDNYKQLQQNIQITYVLVCIVVMIILYITIIYVKQRWYTV